MEIKDELLDIDGIKNSSKPLIELFIRRTAVLTSTQESLCEKIIKDQWKNANKITQGDSNVSEIDFCNLGTFYISPAKARKRIAKLEKMTKSLESKGPDSDVKVENKRNAILLRNQDLLKTIKFKTKQITSKYETEC